MFAKLAFRNVRRQVGSYLVYFVTVTLTVALMFAVNSLICSEPVRRSAAYSQDMGAIFTMVTVFVLAVTALVLGYATSFLLRLRRKEFGLYLTLGMTRRDVRRLFTCETGLLSGLALASGMGLGLLLYQLLMALLSYLLDIPFAAAAYSLEGVVRTAASGAGLFVLASLASLRDLRRLSIGELLRPESRERVERRPVLWCLLAALLLAALLAALWMTYRSLLDALDAQNVHLLFWLAADLLLVFLFHAALARALTGMLLKSRRLCAAGTNTVILRALSGRMTVNALLLGALAALLTFSVAAPNVSFTEKTLSDRLIAMECPFDVSVYADAGETAGPSLAAGRTVVEQYAPISETLSYELMTTGTRQMNVWDEPDSFLSLRQFNALLEAAGYTPVNLDHQYLLVTGYREVFNQVTCEAWTWNGETYACVGKTMDYPDFVPEAVYAVVPDEALTGMCVKTVCEAYTLAHDDFDAVSLVEDLTYEEEMPEGTEERCRYRVQAYYRAYENAANGALIISMLYLATVFVCLALAILSLKTLSNLDEDRQRFAVLYRLGASERLQRRTLFRQTAAFFFLPLGLPLLMSLPFGLLCGEIYEAWGFPELRSLALGTATAIALTVLGIYLLYFCLTYRVACGQVLCQAGAPQEL